MTVIQAYQNLINNLRTLYEQQELSSMFRLILEDLGFRRDELLLRPDTFLSSEQANKFNTICEDLKKERPIQYIFGYSWFYENKFHVKEGVLIPRPETEELVEHIIKKHRNENVNIIDIGSGSGCISISLAMNITGSRLTAVDSSEEALAIAKENAHLHQLNIHFIHDDILKPDFSRYPEKFDIIVSNPPYVRESEKAYMNKNVTFYEPEIALYVSDKDPLIFYREIERFCSQKLIDKGFLYLEINENLAHETADIFINKNYSQVEILNDMQAKNRFLKIQK